MKSRFEDENYKKYIFKYFNVFVFYNYIFKYEKR